MRELALFQWDLLEHYADLKASGTESRTAKGAPIFTHPPEFYVVWGRVNRVMREIVHRRDSRGEVEIAPEVKRELDGVEEKFAEVVRA